MKSKRRIAALIALMFAVPLGVAAVEETASSESAEVTEAPAVQSESTAQSAESPVAPMASGEPAIRAEPITPIGESAAPPVAGGARVAGTAAVGGLVRAQPSDTFPEGSVSSDYVLLPPTQIAYFDQLEQERRHLVALGDAFPEGTRPESEWQMSPIQLAHFDRLEREYMASVVPTTQSDAIPDAAATAEESRNPLRVAWDYVAGLFKRMGAAISSWGGAS